MTTFTALTTLPGRSAAEALGVAMEGMDPTPTGVGVFEIEDGSGLWEVGGYFLHAPAEAELALLATAFGAAPFQVSEVPETDWVAKVRRELVPVEAGRFFLYGSHDADKVPATSVPLLIEAAMAFGTGHHGTTLGCLRAFDRVLDRDGPPMRVADIGCGTAVLAMAAAKTGSEVVLAGDLDEVAVDVAKANVTANGVVGQVRVVEAAGFDHPALHDAAPFDLVFANILKGPLLALAPEMKNFIRPGGIVILSGILNTQSKEVSAHYAKLGFNRVESEEIVDWTTIVMRQA